MSRKLAALHAHVRDYTTIEWGRTQAVEPYVGGRTLRWLKVKQPHDREGERGWEPQKS